ncbi:GGDEF domain-containing protein [Acinetobacter sp. TGL-Y2]|uniref:GGDEF domain-containing protein n=1 Tax=Acinetobacter sp. TGL-Y2 TaxID=1407071 RepID=UPI000AF0AE30|nr:GGDEF domain-containing protein [Acinetobacter sp. TGL-Y2]
MSLPNRIIHPSTIHYFMKNSVLMNWSNLNKSILMLVLGGLDHLLWIAWYIFCTSTPAFQQWMNLDYFNVHFPRTVILCLLSFLLILPCHYFRHIPFFQRYFPYIAIIYFAVTFMYAGYTIGINSPATIAGYVSLVTVGLVLFERKMVYIIFLPITVYLLFAIVLSTLGYMDYAPVFNQSLNQQILYKNEFWVYSQLFLYIPIFFASIVLFEILLTQWRNREKQIEKISQMDPLTGIFNRRKIAHNLAEIELEQHNYALVLLDLDFFKHINDNFGHDIGDDVLQNVAKILSRMLREGDVVGRFGGEEFILVLPHKNLQEALDIAERCRKEIEQAQFTVDKKTRIKVTASFGVAISNALLNKEAVIRHADQALYMAKKQGRNQVRDYFEVLQQQAIVGQARDSTQQ